MNKPAVALMTWITCFAGVEIASAQANNPAQSGPPTSGFFIGGGVGYSAINFGQQSVYNKGISDVYENGTLIASGTADGPPVDSLFGGKSRAAPEVQFGYFQRGGGDWLWGAKFIYSYVGATSGVQNLIIPQYGTSSAPGVSTFSGYSVTDSYSVKINHQFTSLLLVGRSFGQGFLYVGAGPSVSQIKMRLDGVVGYATINGTLTDISGAPQSFDRTDWRVGAAATVGVTHFLTSTIFIDAKYLITVPELRTYFITSPFNNPGTPNSFSGTLIGTANANVRNTQSISVALNKMF